MVLGIFPDSFELRIRRELDLIFGRYSDVGGCGLNDITPSFYAPAKGAFFVSTKLLNCSNTRFSSSDARKTSLL